MAAAAAWSRVFLPLFRRVRNHGLSSSCVNEMPLLQKLLKAPISRIKETLDSESELRIDGDGSHHYPWPALVTSLNNSSPHKANLVIEWKLEKLTKQGGKNHKYYTELISLCENIRNLSTALHVFTSMESQGVKPTSSAFNALISASLSSGNILTALSLFEIMQASEDYKPDADTYDAFISTYARSGDRSETEEWLKAKEASGFSFDAKTYDILINACVKSRNFEDAQRYYEEMVLVGLVVNESIFQNMLLMYCQQRNYAKLKEFSKLIENGNWRVDGNVAKKVVNLYQELGLVNDLEEFLVMLTKSNQTLEVLSMVHSSIIRIYAEKDRLDDVEYSVGRMMKHGITFSCPEDAEKAICCYFRKEAYDRLDLFLECVKETNKLPRSTYDLLGAGYRRAGLSEKLNVLVNEMKVAGFA